MGGIAKVGAATGGLFARPVPGGGWSEWTDAAIEAARAGIRKSIDAAVIVDGSGPEFSSEVGGLTGTIKTEDYRPTGPNGNLKRGTDAASGAVVRARPPIGTEGLGAGFAGSYHVASAAHTLGGGGYGGPTTRDGHPKRMRLATSYAFDRDMELALVRAAVPPYVARAFAVVAWNVFEGWGSSIQLMPVHHSPRLVWEMTQEYPQKYATGIASEVRRYLGPDAAGPEMEHAVQRFAEWLSSSLSRFAAGAVVDTRGPRLISGPRF